MLKALKSMGRMTGLFTLAVGGIAVFFALMSALSRAGVASGDLAGALACGLMMLGTFVGGVLWTKVGRSAFREAHLEVLAPVYEDGTIEFMLVLEPRRPLTLISLACAATFSGIDTGPETPVVLADVRQPLGLPPQLAQRLEHRGVLQVPPRMRPTDDDVQATLNVTVSVDHWPDLWLVKKVQVLPKPPPAV